MPNSIPLEMHRNGRPVDQHFPPEENLYIRFNTLSSNGRVNAAGIRSQNQSVNRSRFGGRPEWVLLPSYSHWGYGVFQVRDIPESLMSPGQVQYNFRGVHVPSEINYYHSEIRAHRNQGGVLEPCERVGSKEVRNHFKMLISESIRILKDPDN